MYGDRAACAARAHSVRVEAAGPRSRGNLGLAVIHRSDQLGTRSRGLAMLHLHRGRWHAVLVRHALLLGARLSREPSGAARIADAIHGDVVDHGPRVHVGDIDVGHVVDFAVVPEVVVTPVTAVVAATRIAEAVIQANVEADLQSTVAGAP